VSEAPGEHSSSQPVTRILSLAVPWCNRPRPTAGLPLSVGHSPLIGERALLRRGPRGRRCSRQRASRGPSISGGGRWPVPADGPCTPPERRSTLARSSIEIQPLKATRPSPRRIYLGMVTLTRRPGSPRRVAFGRCLPAPVRWGQWPCRARGIHQGHDTPATTPRADQQRARSIRGSLPTAKRVGFGARRSEHPPVTRHASQAALPTTGCIRTLEQPWLRPAPPSRRILTIGLHDYAYSAAARRTVARRFPARCAPASAPALPAACGLGVWCSDGL
jgi:hypothetical protein